MEPRPDFDPERLVAGNQRRSQRGPIPRISNLRTRRALMALAINVMGFFGPSLGRDRDDPGIVEYLAEKTRHDERRVEMDDVHAHG